MALLFLSPPTVDLTDLRNVIGQYLDQHGVIVAAGPVAAATLVRTFVSKSRLASTAVVAGGAWLAVQTISNPMLQLMRDQFGYLASLLGQLS